MAENDLQENRGAAPLPPTPTKARRGVLGRLGCGLGLIVWLIVMLIPGFLFLLAIQQEISIWHGGGFPERDYHPALQIKLMMDIDTRGVSITRSYTAVSEDNATCVETQVQYILWQGRGEPAAYCDCYTRASLQGDWSYRGTQQGACSPDALNQGE